MSTNQQCQLWLGHPLSRFKTCLVPRPLHSPSGELPCLPTSKWYSQPRRSRAQFQYLDLSFRTASFVFWLKNKVKKHHVTLAIRRSDFIFSSETPCHSRITRYLPSQKQGQTYRPGGPFAAAEESNTRSAGITRDSRLIARHLGTLAASELLTFSTPWRMVRNVRDFLF